MRIVSLRNLRLPVRILHAGQVGTMGIESVDSRVPLVSPGAVVRIRKGMVLKSRSSRGDGDAGGEGAVRIVDVKFQAANRDAALRLGRGAAVVVYVASVRASAKVLELVPETHSDSRHRPRSVTKDEGEEEDAFGFGLDDDDDDDDSHSRFDGSERNEDDDTVTVRFRIERARVRVERLEAKVDEFAGLPPDREAARKEVARLEVELNELRRRRDGLFEGMLGK